MLPQSHCPPPPVLADAIVQELTPDSEMVTVVELPVLGPVIIIANGCWTTENVGVCASAMSGRPTRTTAAKAKSSTTRFSLRTVFSPSWVYPTHSTKDHINCRTAKTRHRNLS